MKKTNKQTRNIRIDLRACKDEEITKDNDSLSGEKVAKINKRLRHRTE